MSDYFGRKGTYFIFFVLGFALYASVPSAGHSGSVALFVGIFCVILSMYGGGFATVPAYLADMFGTQWVGAIHGRLLTAWSTAGILGPVLVNYLREYQIDHGVEKAVAYDKTMYVLAGLLILGFICNLLVRPVAREHFRSDAQLKDDLKLAHEAVPAAAPTGDASMGIGQGSHQGQVLLAWLLVGVPFAWGVWNTLLKAWVLFK